MDGPIPDPFALDQAYVARFTFDSSTVGASIFGGGREYVGAVREAHFEIGSYHGALSSTGTGDIELRDDFFGHTDQYLAEVHDLDAPPIDLASEPVPATELQLVVLFSNPATTALASDDLPLQPPSLAAFPSGVGGWVLTFESASSFGRVRGDVTELSCVANCDVLPPSDAELPSAEFFPLEPGTSWTLDEDGEEVTRTVGAGSLTIGGVPTTRIVEATPGEPPSTEHWSATAAGVQLHRIDVVEMGVAGEGTLDPPLRIASELSQVGEIFSEENGTITISSLPGPIVGSYAFRSEVTSAGSRDTRLGEFCQTATITLSLELVASAGGVDLVSQATEELVAVRHLGVVQEDGRVDGEPFSRTLVSSSLPLPPEDADCDRILDDGDLSGIAGDTVCAANLLPACDDNCRYRSNAGQLDSAGVGSLEPDGVGDRCQCGDNNDDGAVNLLDIAVLARHSHRLSPGIATLAKCRVTPGGLCDESDLAALRLRLVGDETGWGNFCDAAQPAP